MLFGKAKQERQTYRERGIWPGLGRTKMEARNTTHIPHDVAASSWKNQSWELKQGISMKDSSILLDIFNL